VFFERLRESNISTLDSQDFMITDKRYSLTLELDRCTKCGFIQATHAQNILDYYINMKDQGYEEGRSYRILQFRKILQHVKKIKLSGSLLDVGAGTGILVEEALREGYQAIGIEPCLWMVEQGVERGLPLKKGKLPDIEFTGPYDIITLIDVIEHVTDPAELLEAIRNVLNSLGYLFLVTPNVDSLAPKIFRWHWWHYRIAHINYFSDKTIRLLMDRMGYEVLKIKYIGWYFPLSYIAERLEH
jgi:2-polyprenyl-3-methyl-5-hydroxy-6-metoxy-1,4-benzoquinol methylase